MLLIEYRGLVHTSTNMQIIGLTGGIGTGKTEVASILQELGAVVIHVDRLGHEAYKPGTEVWKELIETFGQELVGPTGEIDRKLLGKMVFADRKARTKLESIVWPRIGELLRKRINDLSTKKTDTIVLEAALLIEAGWHTLVDEIWITCSTKDLVAERLRSRNPDLSNEEIVERVNSQSSFKDKVNLVNVVVNNTATLADLRAQVKTLWKTREKESRDIYG